MAMTTDAKVTKLDIAKEASHLVVDLLDERNEVGVMSWDTEFIWDAPCVRRGTSRPSTTPSRRSRRAAGTDGYPGAQGVVPGPVRAARAPEARHLPVRRADDARGLLRPPPADGQGQDHGLDGGHRQGRRRPAHVRRRQVGPRALLLHRGRHHDPAHLHPRDPARVEGLADRAALQAHAWARPATRPSRTSTGRRRRRWAGTSPPRSRAPRRWC